MQTHPQAPGELHEVPIANTQDLKLDLAPSKLLNFEPS